VGTVLAILGVLILVYLAVSSRAQKRAPRLREISAADQERLAAAEAEAVRIAGVIARAALRRLAEAKAAPTGARRTLAGAAADLVEKRHQVRRGAEPAASAELSFLRASAALRHPLLVPLLGDEGIERLARATEGAAEELSRLFDEGAAEAEAEIAELTSELERRPAAVWSIVELVPLAIAKLGADAPSDAALVRHITRSGKQDEASSRAERAFQLALRLLETTPASRRKAPQGTRVYDLEDEALAATLAAQTAFQAESAPPIEAAAVITRGQSSLLWLASDLVEALGPSESARKFADAEEPVLRAIGGDEAADEDVRSRLGADDLASTALATIRELRAGTSQEQLRGGAAGHEARAGVTSDDASEP
jgi:hypothetical protein